MNKEEMEAELLECARYGELEDMMAFLAEDEVSVDHTDDGGNSALHKACANGHADCVSALVDAGASFQPNGSGNTPLHWAAANGHLPVVNILLEKYAQVDVLHKNGFGQSSLSEAFRSGNTELVTVLLAHPTSSEEKLMGPSPGGPAIGRKLTLQNLSAKHMNGARGTCVGMEGEGDSEKLLVTLEPQEGAASGTPPKTVKVKRKNALFDPTPEENENSSSKGGEGVEGGDTPEGEVSEVHVLQLAGPESPVLRVRELAIEHPDTPFQTDEEDDTTGLGIWCASVILARWCADASSSALPLLRGTNAIELGSGVGVSGLAAALYAQPKRLILTDLHSKTVANAQHNVTLLPPEVASYTSVERLDWANRDTWPRSGDQKKTSSNGDSGEGDSGADSGKKAAEDDDNSGTNDSSNASGSTDGSGSNSSDKKSSSGNKSSDSESKDTLFDVVFGSDLVYDASIGPLLASAVAGLCKANGHFLYVAPPSGRAGLDGFLSSDLMQHGFALLSAQLAPTEYGRNPLESGDETQAFLHFSELAAPYMLYVFQKTGSSNSSDSNSSSHLNSSNNSSGSIESSSNSSSNSSATSSSDSTAKLDAAS